ncbi:hypothetical protein [Citreimonas salinaria]|uniref:Uncharacterized protein n=1 Tax=Citreimonas salinaria TaxID=321339 RepID=A0A1H3NB04_9RHOB|nr:hypothetical protein [Citreimonas salinaria]SDY85934.1 hypothetical protein SAMN05444340_12222 [Citreimonas salinaria]
MPFELFRAPIIPASPAGLSTDELRRYLGVGRNNVAAIARRFGLENLHGIYPESVVWRQLFGLGPGDDAALAALREPLADIAWVSRATGVPQSTIRGHLRSGHWRYDGGVQLGDTHNDAFPRLRRWIPTVIRSRRCGSPLPIFASIPPLPANPVGDEARAELARTTTDEQPPDDVFAALLADPAPASR